MDKQFLFSLCRRTGNKRSLFSHPFFGLVTRRAPSQTGNRGRCVTRPNNGCEGDNRKRGTDAFHFNLEVIGQ